jgi:hypothetical protein
MLPLHSAPAARLSAEQGPLQLQLQRLTLNGFSCKEGCDAQHDPDHQEKALSASAHFQAAGTWHRQQQQPQDNSEEGVCLLLLSACMCSHRHIQLAHAVAEVMS